MGRAAAVAAAMAGAVGRTLGVRLLAKVPTAAMEKLVAEKPLAEAVVARVARAAQQTPISAAMAVPDFRIPSRGRRPTTPVVAAVDIP